MEYKEFSMNQLRGYRRIQHGYLRNEQICDKPIYIDICVNGMGTLFARIYLPKNCDVSFIYDNTITWCNCSLPILKMDIKATGKEMYKYISDTLIDKQFKIKINKNGKTKTCNKIAGKKVKTAGIQ